MSGGPERVLRFLLRLFPEDFRADYGGEMTAAFRDEYRRRGGWRFWLDVLRDFSFAAVQEHWSMTLTDLRVSVRRQIAQPGFTLVAIASLALGIGATTAIFSIIHASLLHGLPFRDAEQLVLLGGHREGDAPRGTVYSADLVDWRERSKSFSQLEMVTSSNRVTVSGGGEFPERVGAQNVTPGYFPMLGVKPLQGRLFTEEESHEQPTVALISESYWQRRYGGDPNVIGRTMAWNGASRTIIGIIPATYRAGELSSDADLWIPIDLKPGSGWIQRKIPWIRAVGRLRDSVPLATAQAELRGIAGQLAQEYPESNRNWTVTVQPLQEALTGYLRNVLTLLLAAAGCVLLIGCANVANLLLARAASRRRELAMRAALGAGRKRLLRELLADGAVLAVPGVLLGLGVAWGGVRLFLGIWDGFIYAENIALHLPVLAFAAAAGAFTALTASVLPAWQASKADVTEVLKEGGRGSAGGRRAWARNGLVVAEIGLAVTLLMGAGLMLRTVQQLQGAALGFDPSGIATLRLDLTGERYASTAPKRDIDMRYVEPAVGQFYDRLLTELRANGWAKDAVWSSAVPMGSGGGAGDRIRISGRTDEVLQRVPLNCVSDGYFSLLRIPMVKGRAIGAQDHAGAQWVAVINETLAAQYFPNEDPIGKYLTVATTEEEQPRLIVGVAANHRRFSQRGGNPPEVYMSFAQQPRLIPGNQQGMRLRPTLAVRTGLDLKVVEQTVRQIAKRLDPALPVYEVKMLVEHVDSSRGEERMYARLLGIFGALALVLAAVGVFGLMHYAVADRRQEIGIRIALGAERKHVLRMVLRQGALLAGAGLVVGGIGAAVGTKTIERMLYGIQRTDPWTAVGVAVLMMGVALLACYLPARRAMAVDPMAALRTE